MAKKTIFLKGRGIRHEAPAAAAITPGMLIERTSTDKFQAHSTSGGKAQPMVAAEDELQGKEISVAWAVDQRVVAEVLPPGAEFYGLLAVGENVSIGDFLVSDGAGALKALTAVAHVTQLTGAVTDDDAAATNGTAVYAHIDEVSEYGIPIAHLESVNAGNTDSDFDIGANGPTIRVRDDDNAATGGLQVYFDEDATNPDERFLINNTTHGKDVFVFATDGRAIRLKHDGSASTNGVALYFDDDAVNEEDRLLFVSPTNAAGSYQTDDDVTLKAFSGPETAVAIARQAVDNSGGSAAARIEVEVI